jgi:hypothetical protein
MPDGPAAAVPNKAPETFMQRLGQHIAPENAELTYAKRLRQYQWRLTMILWVGAGLVALIGLLASNVADGAPRALVGVAATLIILGGGALATARIQFDWAATVLSRAIEDGTAGQTELSGVEKPWPDAGELAWLAGLLCVPAAAIVYLVAVWWASS